MTLIWTARAAARGAATVAVLAALSCVSVLGQSSIATPSTGPTLFGFSQTDPTGAEHTFIFELRDPAKIREARAILANPSTPKRHVQGKVIAQAMPYNPGWTFHLAPNTIAFFEMQIEVCDANVTYVRDHLDEVGGSFLPKSLWCPWTSRLAREIP